MSSESYKRLQRIAKDRIPKTPRSVEATGDLHTKNLLYALICLIFLLIILNLF